MKFKHAPGMWEVRGVTEAEVIDEIRKLPTNVWKLSLRGTPLTNLAGVDFPEDLELLDLGSSDLASLKNAKFPKRLKKLELAYTPLTNLDGVGFPQGLQYLDLRSTKLTSLEGLKLPTSLRTLILSDTPLTDLEGVILPQGLRLERLDLSGTRLTSLPDWLKEIGLPFSRDWYDLGICLHNTTIEGVDMSIFDQPQEVILQWFEEWKSKGDSLLNEIKVVFLGNGDVGKTHTIARLLRDGEKPDKAFTGDSTPGIAISHKGYQVDGRDIQVHFWDFGGQEILYSMHRMFLTERTIYVVMVDARNETKSNQAREWMDTVKSFAGDADVMLVVNKTDQNPGVTVDETALYSEYPNLKKILYMSALKAGKQEFNKTFTAAVLELIRESEWPKKKWPKNWKRVKDALQNLKAPYIRSGDYEQICRECDVAEGGEGLLNWCNDLGVCFCRQDFRLKDYVILRPEWITNAIYTILFNRRDSVRNGMISQSDIDALLRNDGKYQKKIHRVKADIRYSYQDTTYVLDVVRKFHLSYQVDRDTEFFPMLCSENSSTIVQKYAEMADTLEFHIEFDYLPNNVLHRLMVERWQELDLKNVWRTGARFLQKDVGLSAVVKIEDNVLKVYVRSNNPKHHRPNTYLSVISGSIDRIRNELGLPSTQKRLVYKLGDRQHIFDYEELLMMLSDGEETTYATSFEKSCRRVQIEDILNQSAPAQDKEQEQLLEDILKLCADLQAEKIYWKAEEDDRNRYLRNGLNKMPYEVMDQTQRGIGGGEHRTGELDLDIRKFKDIPWTVCEALRVEGVEKKNWNGHLDKLLINYNPNGLRFLVLLTYVDDVRDRFDDIWKGFKAHIRDYAPSGFRVVPNSFHHYTSGALSDYHYIQTARCEYICGDYRPTVYHIFVRMGR